MKHPSNFIDITGQRFGRLVAIKYVGPSPKEQKALWLFKCDCGKDSVTTGKSVRAGKTKSCGCFVSDTTALRNYRHGKSKCGSVYGTWMKIKDRCYNVNSPDYKDYGAKGVVVCEEWIYSFERFFEDMGQKPTPKHSIDRINVKGNYERLIAGGDHWRTG